MRKNLFRYTYVNGVIMLPFILLLSLVSSCGNKHSYSIYQFDNGDDYFCEGLQRIVNKDSKIGFADSLGNVAIEPQFAFAFPFEDGYAKVTDKGKSEPVGEHRIWVSDSWYYIDHDGNTHPDIFDLQGVVFDSIDGSPLNQAFVKNLTNHRATTSKEDGSFSIRVNDGDSINISYAGFYPQTIKANSADSVYWSISMKEIGPIIEPMLQTSYSTTPDVTMTVLNADSVTFPIDSLNVEWRNNTNSRVLFGEWFEIQRKENGQWEELSIDEKYITDGHCEVMFNAIAYILEPHSTANDAVKPWFYGKNLERGIYRLAKTFSFDNSQKQDTAYVEFEMR